MLPTVCACCLVVTVQEDAMQQIAGMAAAARTTGANMRVLVASIRHPQQMALLAALVRGALCAAMLPACCLLEAVCWCDESVAD
jgi:hypothetical protein